MGRVRWMMATVLSCVLALLWRGTPETQAAMDPAPDPWVHVKLMASAAGSSELYNRMRNVADAHPGTIWGWERVRDSEAGPHVLLWGRERCGDPIHNTK